MAKQGLIFIFLWLITFPALAQGDAGWKYETISVQAHKHGKGAEKKLFTDHFPVTATFTALKK